VKAHRGEPANEEADIQAAQAISGKDVPTEWHDRTNPAVFTWLEPRRKGGTVRYEDQKSTWNSGVRKAIRRGSAEKEVRKHRDRVTGAWKQINKQRRRVDVSYDNGVKMPGGGKCGTLRRTATHCNTLQHTATHCNTLQHTATHSNTLQLTATHYNL